MNKNELINYNPIIEQELLRRKLVFEEANNTLNELCDVIDEGHKELESIIKLSKEILLLSRKN